MIIESLKLRNFRNYQNCEIKLSPAINVFVGDNAQGKTNLLESIAFISATRSFRTNDDQDLILKDSERAQIFCVIKENESALQLFAQIFKAGKSLAIQKQMVKKASEFIGVLNAVVFVPDDLQLFDGAPRLRRKLCDLEIGKINREYMIKLNLYQKTLKERNNFLKTNVVDDTYLAVLTQQLIQNQLYLIKERQAFIDELNQRITSAYQQIAGKEDEIKIVYLKPIEEMVDIENALTKRYQQYLLRDKQQKQTLIGIHKDDLVFYINDDVVTNFASQGQKRMIVLALKIALINYIYDKKRSYPVLLLDDVLSELDGKRRKALLMALPIQAQTIITTTDIEDIKTFLPTKTRLFHINQGKIIDMKEMV